MLDGLGLISSRILEFYSVSPYLKWLEPVRSVGGKAAGGVKPITHLHVVQQLSIIHVKYYLHITMHLHGVVLRHRRKKVVSEVHYSFRKDVRMQIKQQVWIFLMNNETVGPQYLRIRLMDMYEVS